MPIMLALAAVVHPMAKLQTCVAVSITVYQALVLPTRQQQARINMRAQEARQLTAQIQLVRVHTVLVAHRVLVHLPPITAVARLHEAAARIVPPLKAPTQHQVRAVEAVARITLHHHHLLLQAVRVAPLPQRLVLGVEAHVDRTFQKYHYEKRPRKERGLFS